MYIRSHDQFYAEEKSEKIKESFKVARNLIQDFKTNYEKSLSIADIGCAIGTFPNYLKKSFPNDNIFAYEYLDCCIKTGNKLYPNLNIQKVNILQKDSINFETHDIITCFGVLSIFDDVSIPVQNLLNWTKKGGKILIFGLFNPYEIDVQIKYRNTPKLIAENQKDFLESGWNILSHNTIKKTLLSYGGKNIKFHEFKIGVDIEKNLSDPVRSWTEMLENGSRIIVNGLCINQPQYFVECEK